MGKLPVLMMAAWLPLLAQEPARFHHIHLNSVDPGAAAEFYAAHFDCQKSSFAGAVAVRTQKSWLLFNKVDKAPESAIASSFWHFGWGAEDMKSTYERELALGAKFDTPLTDISDLANRPGFFYAYVDGPDHALIELNTQPFHRLGHIHLISADPLAAADWYGKHLGIKLRPRTAASGEPRYYKGYQVGPSASFLVDNVNFIIFPEGYARTAYPEQWRERKDFATTRGRVVDHIAFSVADLNGTVERMGREGVKIMEPVSAAEGGAFHHAFVEGPDHVLIELVDAPPPAE